MVLKLIRDECYTDLNHFYANVASRMGFRNIIDELYRVEVGRKFIIQEEN